jgi:hypothetical protein
MRVVLRITAVPPAGEAAVMSRRVLVRLSRRLPSR